MKKIIGGLSVVIGMSVALNIGLGIEAKEAKDINAELNKKPYEIVEEDNFKVIDDGIYNDEKHTIVAVVLTKDYYNSGYVYAMNLHDNKDVTAIQAEDNKSGDIVLISFDGDELEGVEKTNHILTYE